VRGGDCLRHDKNDGRTELWLFPIDGSKARRLTAGDKDSEPQWSPDASGSPLPPSERTTRSRRCISSRRTAAGGATDHACHRGAGLALFADSKRVAFRVVGVAGPQDRQGAGSTKQGAQGIEGQGASHRARGLSLLDHWLTDGREPHVFAADVSTGHTRDLLAGTGLALQQWDPTAEHYDISADGRELALTVDLAPEPGMMNAADIAVVNVDTGRHRV